MTHRFFDNVGGKILDEVILRMKPRVVRWLVSANCQTRTPESLLNIFVSIRKPYPSSGELYPRSNEELAFVWIHNNGLHGSCQRSDRCFSGWSANGED